MTHLLILLVKLARDSGYSDTQLADHLQNAADRVREGRFWPIDIDANSLRYQTSHTRAPKDEWIDAVTGEATDLPSPKAMFFDPKTGKRVL